MFSFDIPEDVREDVRQVIAHFNEEELRATGKAYSARFEKEHVFLDRDDGIGPEPICRLTYNGDLYDWAFEIYKYSADDYDPEETLFPGAELVDGTIEGALRAGMKAYG